jgi:5-methylcytosine-specific restriction endonuclease McrA
VPRTCTICTHEQRDAIDLALLVARTHAEVLKVQHADKTPPERAGAYIDWFCEHSKATRLPGQTRASLEAFLEISRNLEKALKPHDILRRPLPLEVREAVKRRDDYRCSYCGKQGDEVNGPDGRTWHIDHVVPWSRSWDDSLGNLALSCGSCNSKKRDMDAETFKKQLIECNTSATGRNA